jgi:ribosome-associated heat shock protein Hsp15
MDTEKKVRMDQWLAAVRICKTRSLAAELCKKNKVLVNGIAVKPSYTVKLGEMVEMKAGPITRTFRVLGLHQKRVSAKAAEELVEETTSAKEFDKLRMIHSNPFAHREKGAGRPTKKERREIDRLKNN